MLTTNISREKNFLYYTGTFEGKITIWRSPMHEKKKKEEELKS